MPNGVGRLGSLLETFLPWLGLAVPVLLALALWRRSAVALFAVLLPAAAWAGQFAPLLYVPSGSGTAYGITVVQHNVSDENPDPAAAARALRAGGADVIALEELTASALPSFEEALAVEYPHHAVTGTVGVWSKFPLRDVRPVDIRPSGVGPGWNRGLRATAVTPEGQVALYVAHLPSIRLSPTQGLASARRDESARLLGAALADERLEKVIVLGDLNGTVDDRGLAPVISQAGPADSGFALSWPAGLPLARIDQVLARGASVTRVWTLPSTGSDHLPVAARVEL
ncbi:endonuclease/exonuclease/phosphatase family protein [Streptomyces sp. T-3]|nr:endonuclease/exonuclease/phosphatase family protein [Streptomyces sp. T-3]